MSGLPWPQSLNAIPESLSGEQAVALVLSASSKLDRMLKVVRKRRSVSRRRANRLMRAVLRSPTMKLAGLAAEHCERTKKLPTPTEALKLIHRSKHMSAWKNTGEPVKRFQPKNQFSDKERWVYDMGFERSALSKALHRVAEAMTDLHPNQFIGAGGAAAFERWFMKVQSETVAFLTTDVPSCYDRVLRSDIGSPFPGAVLTSQLYDPMDQAKTFSPSLKVPCLLVPQSDGQSAFKSSGKRGIPQGAALASIHSEIAIAKVLSAIEAACPNAQVAAYGDNLIVALKNESDKSSVIAALESATAEVFGADTVPELLSRLKISPAKKPLHFCRRTYRSIKGKLYIQMTEQRAEDWLTRFSKRVTEIKTPEDVTNAHRSMLGFVRSASISKISLDAYVEAKSILADAGFNET